LPPEIELRDAAYVPFPVLIAFEDFRNGRAVLGAEGTPVPDEPRDFSGWRLYAQSLDDVEPLAQGLSARGIEVATRADEIAAVKRLDRDLSLVFTIVAGLGGGGFVLSLGLSLFANVDRKRRHLSSLRLIGFTGADVASLPVA